jgi:hypothetical protein
VAIQFRYDLAGKRCHERESFKTSSKDFLTGVEGRRNPFGLTFKKILPLHNNGDRNFLRSRNKLISLFGAQKVSVKIQNSHRCNSIPDLAPLPFGFNSYSIRSTIRPFAVHFRSASFEYFLDEDRP